MNGYLLSNFQLQPNERSIFWLLSFLILGFGLQKANALNPGAVSIENKSGPSFILDSNKPCKEGPEASYVAYRVCNTSGSTLTNLTITLSGLSAGFSLAGGQSGTQAISSIEAGVCRSFFWYVSFPCTANKATEITITVTDGNPGKVLFTNKVATTNNLSASAGGQVIGMVPGPEIAGGVPTWFDIEYQFGNIPKDGVAIFQPAGNLDFNAGCMQLTNFEVLASDIPNTIPVGGTGALYYIAPKAAGGGGHRVTVRYFFDIKCSGFTTELVPFAAATSGNKVKYSSNYSATIVHAPEDFRLAFDPCNGDPNDFALQKVGSGSGLEHSGDNWSASWGDYDGDGYPDLFVTTYEETQPNELYHNNRNGTFTKITSGPIATDKAISTASSWADYDNDGDLDLYVSNNIGQPNFLYRNEWGGKFTSIQNDPAVSYHGYSHGVSWADYDNDGFLDLFVGTYWETAFNQLYHNNGNGTFTQVTNNPIVNEAAKTITGVWGDYDNDGWVDLFVVNSQGTNNSLYHNIGNGNFQKITSGDIVTDIGWSVGANWGDYNNDGYLDLFVANASDEANFLYKNNGNGTFSKITSGSIVTDLGHSHGSAWADYDNDGDIDLFVANDGQNNSLYRNNGDGTFTSVNNAMTNDGGLSFGCAWADFDQDGDVDLFVANRLGKENFLYENTKGSCNNWYSIDLVGTNSNTSAVGARVSVTALINGKVVTQVKQVSSQTGGGTGGQNELTLHFGLGNAAEVSSVVVNWPSGYRQELAKQPVNINFILTEINSSEVCGTVYYDANDNCRQEPGEPGVPDVKVELKPGNITAYTDNDGHYSVFAKPGTYSILETPKAKWVAKCPNTSTVTITGLGKQYCGFNFGNTTSCALPDLRSVVATTAHRIGSVNLMVVNFENIGVNKSTNTRLSVSLPPQIQLLSSSIPYSNFVENVAIWNLGDLLPGRKGAIYLTYEVLAGTALGINLHVTSTLSANESECDLNNNAYSEISPAVASFDPNDILVKPEGFVRKDGWLHYKIRFQNVGNAAASQVRVENDLPQELDFNTIELGTASHLYKFQADGRQLVWTFPNINLPDSLSNEQGSHGFITYRIKPKAGLEEGDRIFNQANIYFDNHQPVVTNAVENIISDIQQSQSSSQSLPLFIYPNPTTTGYLTVQLQDMDLKGDAHFVEIQVFDSAFKLVVQKSNVLMARVQLSLGALPSGIYIIQGLDNKGRVHAGKVILY